MQLFYNETLEQNISHFEFDKQESKHIVRVLRKKEGDTLYITNGKGFLFVGKITFANDKHCTVSIEEILVKPKTWNFHLHLAVAPTKLNDRYEWFLEKAVEIGVDEITPIICDHSERKVIKKERMEKIILSAMKQSLKYTLPKLNDPIKLSQFLDTDFEGQKFIAHCEETEKVLLKNSLEENQDTLILIGPEGDFSTKEIEKAISKNFKPVSLGNSRLRTETAAVVACHSVSFFNE
ncbi:16S rRNA (uracil(1498)-N(3))-methyltransferase [Aureivirga sp. CE67]|uniref:16S rRNA (uracil(1498)-N(3))-methyltransferase n=1 Tax=Aureivirga sp. CE67 TaxID=1788983 RepID=UPI0018CB830C|nr:16S rRNA (uracil(1498)-N(3))-methyltransferase [Aureivirga sp. CE67]